MSEIVENVETAVEIVDEAPSSLISPRAVLVTVATAAVVAGGVYAYKRLKARKNAETLELVEASTEE